MRQTIALPGLLAIVTIVAFAQPQQAPMLNPGEEDGFQFVVRQRAFPLGYIPAGVDVQALRRVEAMERTRRPVRIGVLPAIAVAGSWAPIGPNPLLANFATGDLPAGGTNYFGGSIWALAVDPNDKNIVYCGGAGGGVWKSTDGGKHWSPLTDSMPWLSIGSLAIDPSNSNNVYAGTGWPFNLYGDGILKSTDAGVTWTYIAGPFSAPVGSSDYFGGGSRILALSVNPSNSSIILAAAWGWGASNGGIFRSINGGNTWTRVLSGGRGSMVFYYPSDGNIAYASLGDYYGSAGDGVYKSTDGGATWEPANGTGANVLPSAGVGNIILTPALSSPTTMYAAISQSGSSNFLGFYKTTDGGQNWTKPSTLLDLPADPPQTMAVNPTNPSIVITGSHDYINRSLDGGVTWTRAIPPRFTDNRYFLFSADGSRLYIGDDAGAYSTDTPTTTFQMTNLNQTLPMVLFYPGLSLHPTNPSIVFGGAQDLGINQYGGSPTWNWVYNCDGGATAIDFVTPTNIYATCQSSASAVIIKSTASGANGTWASAQAGVNTADRPIFIPPLTMDPSNSARLYYGATHIYQTANSAGSWQAISPALTSDASGFSSTSAIAVAPGNPSYVYAGTADGSVWVTPNALLGTLSTWSNVTAGLPRRAVAGISVDPASATTAYVVLSGFSGFGDTQGHIFQTIDAGAHWQDISNNLPNIPLDDCVIDPDIDGTLYVASDMAVFVSTDGGATWNVMGTGMPRVIVHSLKLHRPTRTLRAATFGRGMWDIPVPLPGTTAPALNISLSHAGTFPPSLDRGHVPGEWSPTRPAPEPLPGKSRWRKPCPMDSRSRLLAGAGWTCTGATCTRGDPLNAGSPYPGITVKVNVVANPPALLANVATVTGGGSAPLSVTDETSTLSPCDVDGNRTVTVSDVQTILNQALGKAAPSTPLTQNGTVTVVDAQLVIDGAAGLTCFAQ